MGGRRNDAAFEGLISSPSDVEKERYQALLAISKLARYYVRYFAIESFMWEHEPQLANKGHFQDAIEPPSSADVVLVVKITHLSPAEV